MASDYGVMDREFLYIISYLMYYLFLLLNIYLYIKFVGHFIKTYVQVRDIESSRNSTQDLVLYF